MLELTDGAVKEIRELAGDGGLRFVGRPGEKGSFEFDASLADEPEDGDQVVDRGGVRVFLDALAAEELADQILEVEPHGDHVHFNFLPQGGGESPADDDSPEDS
jgi:iron-sulfur cluster assembly protein